MTTFVLIPGAGTDPRVYGATIAALRERGHDGLAPPLPLDRAEATPSEHAAAIVADLPDDPAETVVVGHSLGAYSASLAAAARPVSQLILLAPMIPAPGESAGEWWTNTDHAAAIPRLIARHGPLSEWGPEAMADAFLHDVEPRVYREAERYDGVPGPGMFAEPWPLAAWPEVPTRVLAPTEDRLFPLEFQRRLARQRLDLELDEMPGGHLPMLSRPTDLATRLIDLASQPDHRAGESPPTPSTR